MQKVHPPILLGGNKPSIHSLLLSQDQVKNPQRDEYLSGWNFSSNNNHYINQHHQYSQYNIQPLKSFDNNNNNGGYIHESKKFKFSQDQFNSSDESDNGEYSPKPRYNNNSNNGLDSMMKHFGSNSLPTFRQFQQHLTVSPSQHSSSSSSSSLHSSPSSASSSPSYSVPIVALQSENNNSSDFKSPYEQPHSPSNNSDFKNKQIQQWLQELQQIKKRESILLENLKYYNVNSVSSPSSSFSSDESDEDLDYGHPTQQPQSPLQQPITSQPIQQASFSPSSSPQQALTIQQQPSETIICNRYIHPAIVVLVDQDIINQTSGYLIVNASLSPYPFKGNNIASQNNLSKNQQLLQGVKSILVEKNGFVIFNKLKLNEVSAKYPNQLFCISFTLSDISSDKQIRVVSQVASTPFHIISKPNKRKCDEMENEEPSSPKSNSPPSSPSLNNIPTSGAASSSSSSSNKLVDECSAINTNDPNYIDITDLLILPQKEAAARLGISESMLCKRFKECTRRKWPYRYLRKIDKFIKLLSLQNINEIPKEEKEKLERYILEREECLRPVKIRITGCVDKDDPEQFTSNLNFNKSTHQLPLPSSSSTGSNIPSKSQIQNIINGGNEDNNNNYNNNNGVAASSASSSTKLFEGLTTGGEGKGLENILETLEMLKHTHRQ
ncbi:hypothetical protein DICPUDRAFT_153885 [Dictyostelium purpureum]|uniref:RWP-RK domain-containing protein n=1 Tax=Dictyostelium purpureum TaxID=5786 RepID=F0ZPZ7_DICPU|nr:uncharacterized protein DICPUDRAFT_153885 [Dictyostelium purpureum]EGC34005.1 hypothetical protein DICPUDRAFT_153885 [Dictyostelium purpureum]|eukprot:XP_003289491.1 hypothetical protein DICPUDRAFT_153885 [Dictyostelium purpureum]